MYNIECRLKMIFNKSVIILGVLYLFPLGAKCQELDSIASEKLPESVGLWENRDIQHAVHPKSIILQSLLPRLEYS